MIHCVSNANVALLLLYLCDSTPHEAGGLFIPSCEPGSESISRLSGSSPLFPGSHLHHKPGSRLGRCIGHRVFRPKDTTAVEKNR